MIPLDLLQYLKKENLFEFIGDSTQLEINPVSGGCICNSVTIKNLKNKIYFIKWSSNLPSDQLEKESRNLKALKGKSGLQIPQVYSSGHFENYTFLILEYLSFSTPKKTGMAELGAGLAELHQNNQNLFGWPEDNYIGATVQINSPTESWLDFYCQSRLLPQVKLAEGNGLKLEGISTLLENIDVFIPHYKEIRPSFLHGDLWAGNIGFHNGIHPCVFDPACYFGDPEIDIAMTHLFEGFSTSFYEAYHKINPLIEGYRERQNLYNLYPILNHFNLFRGHYGQTAQQIVSTLLQRI